jgi:restriction system protein
MPVPDYETMMLPVLRMFADGAISVGDCVERLKTLYGLTDEEASELIPSGRISILGSRAHWARTYLSKAGLLSSPRRNVHVITDLGRQVLAANPPRIDNDFLDRYQPFADWRVASRNRDDRPDQPSAAELALPPAVPAADRQTPEDAMQTAHQTLDAALRDDLLGILRGMEPARFERLILDLLTAMGYGAGRLGSNRMTSATGDGGIDGIIHEDALGLDAVYIQAKCYAAENRVGRPAIQQFIGSLTGEGANKGVFVTTSDFSREARDYLNRVQQRVVLINGHDLAGLLIRHGVGVRVRMIYEVKGVDEDYFAPAERM